MMQSWPSVARYWTRSTRVTLALLTLVSLPCSAVAQPHDPAATAAHRRVGRALEVGVNTFELLSYQAAAYRFQVIDPDATPPTGFEQPDFDDSTFRTGSAAFGSGGTCDLQATVRTEWPVNSQVLIRRTVVIPAGASNVRMGVSVDNDIVGVFFNGTRIADFTPHEHCPVPDEIRFDVPQELVQPGQNLIAFHVHDRGEESFFDARILADLTTTEVAEIVADLQRAAEERLPAVSVSALSISACEMPTPDGARGRITVEATVDATSQRARMIVTAGPQRRAIAAEHALDGQTMYTTMQTPRRARVTVKPGTEPSNQRGLMNVSAFPAVLQQPRVVAKMVECFAAIDHFVRPETPCRENIGIAEENCQQACTAQRNATSALCAGSNGLYCGIVRTGGFEYACIRECENAATTLRRNCLP